MDRLTSFEITSKYPPKKQFVKKEQLLAEIAKSKNSFCWFEDRKNTGYDTTSLAPLHTLPSAFFPEGTTVRVLDDSHVPRVSLRTRVNDRGEPVQTAVKCNFTPFRHYTKRNGEWVETARSHWKGDLQTGRFSCDHGQVTDMLALQLMRMVEKFGNRANWRGYSYVEEMKGHALMELIRKCLKFNEHSLANPFSYYTRIMHNDFKFILAREKQQATIMQDLSFDAGVGQLTHSQMAKIDIDRYYGVQHDSHKSLEGERVKRSDKQKTDSHFSGLFKGI